MSIENRRPAARARSRSSARSLADRAYERLRAAIVTLGLAPGAPLAELDVSKRLGISRTPVRAALARLAQEGLVVVEGPRRGRTLVAPLTAEDMRELFLMVGALDGVAARLAARLDERRRREVADQAAEVNQRLARLSASDAADIRAAQELDLAFHRSYEAAASGPRLLAKLAALHARRERYVRVYTEALVHAHGVHDSLQEHLAIVAAIRAGDPEAARRSALFNHRHALERYDRILAARRQTDDR